jgi:hypothetical protein
MALSKGRKITWRLVVIIAMQVRIPCEGVYRNARRCITLMGSPEVPYLYGPIFTSRHQPLSLTMKRYRSDIGGVAFEGDDLCSSLEKCVCEGNRRSNYGSG